MPDATGMVLLAALMSLAGSEWAPANTPKPQPSSDIFVRFTDDRVTGSGGCNAFSGPYMQEGPTIRIGPIASTRKACAEPVMEKERAFIAILEAARSIEATHTTLKISDDRDREVGWLVRRDWD